MSNDLNIVTLAAAAQNTKKIISESNIPHIDDDVEASDSCWSSMKTAEEIRSIESVSIDDEHATSDTCWSGLKTYTEINGSGFAVISDNEVSDSKTWSSTKLSGEQFLALQNLYNGGFICTL